MQSGSSDRVQRNVSPLYDQAKLTRKSSHRQPHPSYDASISPSTSTWTHSIDAQQYPSQGRKDRAQHDPSQLSRRSSHHHPNLPPEFPLQRSFSRTPSSQNLAQSRKQKSSSGSQEQGDAKAAHKSFSRLPGSAENSLSRKSSFRHPADETGSDLRRSNSRATIDPNGQRISGISSIHLQSTTDDGSLKRAYSQRVQPTYNSRSSQKSQPVDNSKDDTNDGDTVNLRRLSSLKPGRKRLTAEEREERRRVRNRENSRRIREKQRQERRTMERIYDENEVRIKELEKFVDELSSELERSNTISGPAERKGPSQSSKKETRGAFKVPEERPGWFGDSF